MKYVSPIHLFRTVMKANELKPGRLLGLDVGNKYVGLAISDRENREALPLSVLVRKQTNIDLMAKDFRTLISELSLGGLVIGCCYSRNVSQIDSFQVKDLVKDLCKRQELEDVKFTYWEERFTSKVVENTINPLKYLHNDDKSEAVVRHRYEDKTAVDKLAAVAILQEYLDFMHRSSQLHTPSSIDDEEISVSGGT
ncbi:hypothetical protein MKW94_013195 [Papaver nudicaule]|uniref:YqgF/RNase H-like domain-containing protein n=1 Tax=Papaver nudicaule TaxID=74823 RepID=A0AA41V485_PAPNU|nr:hypothetical protein [Papaver nudicaule]